MPIKVGLGHSRSSDPIIAGTEAMNNALTSLGEEADILMVFSSSHYDQAKMIKNINKISHRTKIIGCTTAGEITNKGIYKRSIVIAALKGEGVEFLVGYGQGMDKDAKNMGRELAQNIFNQKEKIKSMIIFPDGLAGNGSDVIKGIQDIISQRVLLIGGSAGDDFASKQTYQFMGDKIMSKSIVGVGLAGIIRQGVGIAHGWIPVGMGRIATKSIGNKLYELDNNPALGIYLDYMGEEVAERLRGRSIMASKEGATRPLGIKMSDDSFMIRQPFFSHSDGSLTCAAEIPPGSEVFLMLSDTDSVIDSARIAAQNALKQMSHVKPSVAFVFSCGARSMILGENSSSQIEAIKEVIGENIPLIGFVCYGEIAPLDYSHFSQNTAYFHNESVLVYLLA